MHALRMNRETEDSLSWFHRSLGRDAAEEVLKRSEFCSYFNFDSEFHSWFF